MVTATVFFGTKSGVGFDYDTGGLSNCARTRGRKGRSEASPALALVWFWFSFSNAVNPV